MSMKLKVVSDGSPNGTRVFDSNGIDVTESMRIVEVVWCHRAGEVPRVEITSEMSSVELIGDVHG